VLIADPIERLLESYNDYLSERGFQVQTATNGLECLEKLQEFVPNVLVMEPAMPWGGGDGVLALMHEDPDLSEVPVLVLTYGRDPSVLYNISSFSISDFQKKPMTAKQLMERISKIITTQPMEPAYGRNS